MKTGHDGDCWVYAVKICTCGYFHRLIPSHTFDGSNLEIDDAMAWHSSRLAWLNTPPAPAWWDMPRIWWWRWRNRKMLAAKDAEVRAWAEKVGLEL